MAPYAVTGQHAMLSRPYRWFALALAALSLLTLLFTAYFIWARVIITILPVATAVERQIEFRVTAQSPVAGVADQESVFGSVQRVIVEGSSTGSATGKETVASDAIGEVTIINNYSKDQTLVESTRLAAPETPGTILVRLGRTVTVAAGQKVKVPVYPANPETFTQLPAMRFIIPGLWGPLQEHIYAESADTLAKGRAVPVVAAEDLTTAQNELREKLYQQAITQVNESLEPEQSLWPKVVSVESAQTDYSAAAGDQVSEFSVTMKLTAAVTIFDESQVVSLIRRQLRGQDETSGEEIAVSGLDPAKFEYTVKQFDADAQRATISVAFTGAVIDAAVADGINTSELLGLTEDEIKTKLLLLPNIQDVKVEFRPVWLRKTPRMASKIEIRVGE